MGEYALAKYVSFHPPYYPQIDLRLLTICLVVFFYIYFSYTNVKSVHVNLGIRM